MVERTLCLSWFIGIWSESLTSGQYTEDIGEFSYSEETTTRVLDQDGMTIHPLLSAYIHLDSDIDFIYSCFIRSCSIKFSD